MLPVSSALFFALPIWNEKAALSKHSVLRAAKMGY